MKCPKCGLVHANSEKVCRRCGVDIITGDPVSREQKAQAVKAGGASRMDRIKAMRTKPKQEQEPAAAVKSKRPSAKPPAAKGVVLSSSKTKKRSRKKAGGLMARFKKPAASKSAVRVIECIECQAQMHIEMVRGYGLTGPIALIILAAALLVAGFLAWPVWLLSPVALGLGIWYLRSGQTRWHCPSCGYNVSRV